MLMLRDWDNDIIDTSEFDYDIELDAILNGFNSQEDDLHQSGWYFDQQTC